MDLAQYVSRFCKENEITKNELAQYADMSRSSLYRMLDKDSSPTLINLIKLSVAMQVHPQYLVKLEWHKYCLRECNAKPVNQLKEPNHWFNQQIDSAHFISETIADGSLVCTGERFMKTWRIQNTGNEVWEDRRLECQDNWMDDQNLKKINQLFKNHNVKLTPVCPSINIPTTLPGNTVDLQVEFIAPSVPAYVMSYWKMTNKYGEICFPESLGVYIAVQVISSGAACNMPNEDNPSY